jgi:flavin-dependent dehydrogenase
MLTNTKFDVVILGTGPAGLQAAIHAARKKVDVLVMGKAVGEGCVAGIIAAKYAKKVKD